MPFVIAPAVSLATVRSRLHAREYFEWMCRSAIQFGANAAGAGVGAGPAVKIPRD